MNPIELRHFRRNEKSIRTSSAAAVDIIWFAIALVRFAVPTALRDIFAMRVPGSIRLARITDRGLRKRWRFVLKMPLSQEEAKSGSPFSSPSCKTRFQ